VRGESEHGNKGRSFNPTLLACGVCHPSDASSTFSDTLTTSYRGGLSSPENQSGQHPIACELGHPSLEELAQVTGVGSIGRRDPHATLR